MAGQNVEKMAQLEYNKMKAQAEDILKDIEELEKEMDDVLDSSHPDFKELDRLIGVRDNTYQNYLTLREELKDFLKEWEYCIKL